MQFLKLLIYLHTPFYFRDDPDGIEPINSLPGIARYGINQLGAFIQPLINNGLHSVLLFGVPSNKLAKVSFCDYSSNTLYNFR